MEDPKQGLERVLSHAAGPLVVLGGPGSGKTAALEKRFLRLASSAVPSHQILFLCTNRQYSMQAKDRLFWEMSAQASIDIPVYTWHGLAYHLVSRYYPKLGYHEPPVLLTGPEQWGVVRELLAGEADDQWPTWRDRLHDRGFIDEVADFCLRVQQRTIADATLEAFAERRPEWAEVVAFYHRYREHLKKQSRLDYAGLIAGAGELLSNSPDVSDTMKARFPHLLVDDGQELSEAHRRLLGQLDTSNLVIAADPNSGIETFRGAQPDWIFGFEKEFGPHETIVLATSHRLGEPALAGALSLIAHNEPEVSVLPSAGARHATTFEARTYTSTAEEVEAIGRELRALHLAEGVAWKDLAVLVSQPSVLLAPLERALDRWEVPFQPMSGDRPLASEPAVSWFLDLVRVSLGLDPDHKLLPNLLTSPLIGMDYSTRRRLERAAWQEQRSFTDVINDDQESAELKRLRSIVVEHALQADDCFWEVFSDSTFYQGLVKEADGDPSSPAHAHLDALVAFSHSLSRFVERRRGRGSIGDYLTEAARADFGGDPWLAPNASRADRVELLSFHSARGREWDTVIVAGCLDQWIPKGSRAQGLFDPFTFEAPDASAREVEAIADDRRTFYVAATRAKRRTLFTVSPGPSGRGRPTRFLAEMGALPQEVALDERPPLTFSEMRSRLRRRLASADTPATEKVAAAIALTEVPGTDPENWYGRWRWTEGTALLAEPGELRTSYSRLGVYENCGLQYLLQSVLGLDPASSHSMKFGTWIHALFEAVHNRKINDIPTLKAEYNRLFDDTAFPNATIARQFRRDGEKMLRIFWENEFSQDNVLTEYKFDFDYAGAKLRGRIDRIDVKNGGILWLSDYKTAKWAPSSREAERSLQLAIYFLAAKSDEKLRELGTPKVARLVFPGSTWPDGRHKVLKQSDEQAEVVIEELPQLIESVLKEDFKPSPHADCHFCRMKPLCPLWPEGREIE